MPTSLRGGIGHPTWTCTSPSPARLPPFSAHLSGGERTSVSLAYRLALNTLLRRETRSLRSNLLVLDEPTDGFSKSQLSKVHSILKALDYEQIIVVSHDRELEAHADHVFHVTKEGGSSSVRAA